MRIKKVVPVVLAGLLAVSLGVGSVDFALAQEGRQELSTRGLVVKNCVNQNDYEPVFVPEGICSQTNSKNKRAAAKFKPRGNKEKVAVT